YDGSQNFPRGSVGRAPGQQRADRSVVKVIDEKFPTHAPIQLHLSKNNLGFMNYLHSIRLIPVIALCVVASWGSAPLFAQSNDAELQQMRATMQEMTKTIQVLQKRVADLEKKEAVKKKEEIAAPSGAPAAKPSA